jgi:ABC-type hemin transport system ATPase subunit
MRIPSFEVQNQRSIRLARCEALPRLMVIAGPNGAGKSTLLNSIRANASYSNVMYVGPHRAMRKQQVQQRHLMTGSLSLEAFLASPNVPGMEGIRIFDGNRDPWGYDESANYLKHTLCQVEVDRLQAIGSRADRDGQILPGSLLDPWKPLRELVANLLPHMSFEKIDMSNRDQVRVLFRVHKFSTLTDLDDLSSGEKSIIQMFYPLVEREIKSLVRRIDADVAEPADARPQVCVMIDEPELHLHPNLQLKVLDYLRVLSSGTKMQVIVATHSPTIVEGATHDELFLLRPAELTEPDENQLVRLAADEERLSELRRLFGDTHNLTSLQPVVVVEGKADAGGGRSVPDRKIYRAIHPGFDRVTTIAGGGKGECISLAQALRQALADFSPRLQVVALVDRDISTSTTDVVRPLGVSMVENLLIDPDVIFEAIESVRDRAPFVSVGEVTTALDQLINDLERFEIDRRAAHVLGASHFYPSGNLDDLRGKVEGYLAATDARYSLRAIADSRTAATTAVDGLRAANRRREEFDGKKVLSEFFSRHLAATTLSKPVFTFYAARRARTRRSVLNFFDEFFRGLSG